jgi:hypothetical protein
VAKTPKTAIVIDTDEKPAIKGLKNLVKAYGSAATQISAGLDVVSRGWGFVTGAISGTVEVLSEYVELAAEQERVELRVRAAIRRRVEFTDEEFDALQALNAERQRALGIGDEAQLQLQGTLVAMGLNKEQLNAATEATIGLAEATGQGLKEASKTVAKAFGGNIGVLKEYGITVGSVAEAEEELAGLFEVASAQSDTLATKMRVLDAAVGDTKETIGGAVNESEGLKDLFDTLTDSVEDLGRMMAGKDGVAIVDAMAQALSGMAAGAINAALGARTLARDIANFDRTHTGGKGGALWDLLMLELDLFASPEEVNETLKRIEGVFGGKAPELLEIPEADKRLQALADKFTAAANRKHVPGEPRKPRTSRKGGAGGGGAGGSAADFLEPELTLLLPEDPAETLRRSELAKDQKDREREDELDAYFEHRKKMQAVKDEADAEFLATEEQYAEDLKKPGKMISDAMESAIANGIVNMTSALMEGENVLVALRGFVGDIVVTLGNTLIQMGATAIAMGALGSIPAFLPWVGTPGAAIAVGAAAVAVGAGVVAVGNAMGGRGGATSARTSGGGGGGSRLPDALPGGFNGGNVFGRGNQPQASVINVTFNGITDPRRVRREMQDLMAGS